MDSIGRRKFLQALSAAAAGLAPFHSAWALDDSLQRVLKENPTLIPATAVKPAPRRTVPKPYTVVVDAGHGGVDPGCIGRTGTYEKDVVLDTALRLARGLEATKRYKVSMSRHTDDFVTLEDRVIRARNLNADLFISVHADALPERSERGASVFTLSEKASDKEAAMVAERENKSDLVAGVKYTADPQVNEILFDLARRQTNNLSLQLAQKLVSELGHRVRLLNHTHRSAAFVVLKAPDIPSALVETGCLSNADEERDLRNANYRQMVSGALLNSVNAYFDVMTKQMADG
ncbi:MAG TPA: N-acetylmuramoyl-L-alanine amidase [Stellaceae bacterium]|jgi:N-acetylmuramoyl-L-alanine amidase|nr:N-acetylmuramoyl-L-alanine amidase [Stellaceae bacterium]